MFLLVVDTLYVTNCFIRDLHSTTFMTYWMVESSWNVDGTRWRTGGEVKGKLANGVGSQYPSQYLGTWCIQHYYRWCAHLSCQQSTKLTLPADLNGLVRFAERRNLVSARVPSHFNWPLRHYLDLCPWICLTICVHQNADFTISALTSLGLRSVRRENGKARNVRRILEWKHMHLKNKKAKWR